MDLCCLIDSKDRRDPSALVQLTSDLLERGTPDPSLSHVVRGTGPEPLSLPPRNEIPSQAAPACAYTIVKLSLNPSPGLPFGISCDIGFENRLALENTRLLMSYAAIDPLRVRTMVLFRK